MHDPADWDLGTGAHVDHLAYGILGETKDADSRAQNTASLSRRSAGAKGYTPELLWLQQHAAQGPLPEVHSLLPSAGKPEAQAAVALNQGHTGCEGRTWEQATLPGTPGLYSPLACSDHPAVKACGDGNPESDHDLKRQCRVSQSSIKKEISPLQTADLGRDLSHLG